MHCHTIGCNVLGTLRLVNIRLVIIQVIGENEVTVPTHLFKVVMAVKKNTNPAMATFIVPNEPIDDKELTEFQVIRVDPVSQTNRVGSMDVGLNDCRNS